MQNVQPDHAMPSWQACCLLEGAAVLRHCTALAVVTIVLQEPTGFSTLQARLSWHHATCLGAAWGHASWPCSCSCCTCIRRHAGLPEGVANANSEQEDRDSSGYSRCTSMQVLPYCWHGRQVDGICMTAWGTYPYLLLMMLLTCHACCHLMHGTRGRLH